METRPLNSTAASSYLQNAQLNTRQTELNSAGSTKSAVSAPNTSTSSQSNSLPANQTTLPSTQSVNGVAAADARGKTTTTDPQRVHGDSFLQSSDSLGPEQIAARQEEDLLQIRELAQRDREVRAHEAAHAAAGGAHAGAPSFDYTKGPDGRLYATGGQVSVDTSAVPNDPEATIAKAESIIRAALAPANPSPEDIQVAAQAQALLAKAQSELATNTENPLVTEESNIQQSAAGEESDSAVEPLDREKLEENRKELEKRLSRTREQQADFADQLQELNRKVNTVLQQLIQSGSTTGLQPQGTFIDLVV